MAGAIFRFYMAINQIKRLFVVVVVVYFLLYIAIEILSAPKCNKMFILTAVNLHQIRFPQCVSMAGNVIHMWTGLWLDGKACGYDCYQMERRVDRAVIWRKAVWIGLWLGGKACGQGFNYGRVDRTVIRRKGVWTGLWSIGWKGMWTGLWSTGWKGVWTMLWLGGKAWGQCYD